MSQIVRKRSRFGKVFVQPHRPRQRPRDLRDLDGVSHPRAEHVLLVRDKNLRLEVKPPEGGTMHYPVAVPLEAGAVGVLRFGKGARAAVGFGYRPRRKPFFVKRLVLFTQGCHVAD
jgi:hypothetical protein